MNEYTVSWYAKREGESWRRESYTLTLTDEQAKKLQGLSPVDFVSEIVSRKPDYSSCPVDEAVDQIMKAYIQQNIFIDGKKYTILSPELTCGPMPTSYLPTLPNKQHRRAGGGEVMSNNTNQSGRYPSCRWFDGERCNWPVPIWLERLIASLREETGLWSKSRRYGVPNDHPNDDLCLTWEPKK